MNAGEWATCLAVGDLYAGLPQPPGGRKLRLWVTACARRMIHAFQTTPRPESCRWWLIPPNWGPILEAAEAFADGEIDHHALRASRNLQGGGPYNVFWVAAGLRHFTHRAALGSVDSCSREYGIPSARECCDFFRDIFGNPFRPVAFDPSWRTDTVVSLARGMYESLDFAAMPILADALQDAGCEDAEILDHCRDGALTHVRGCWVVDLVLGKE